MPERALARVAPAPPRRSGQQAAEPRPAFYAAAPGSAARDWWTVLHPPYTAWHLSYVVIGASLAPRPAVSTLLATLAAFFLAVGVAAHALDEMSGRPLRTHIPSRALAAASVIALGGAAALGCLGVQRVGLVLIPFIVVGVALVLAYNLELFGGRLHSDVVFAFAWGAFPVLVGYVAEAHTVRLPAVLAGAAAFALSWAQRSLSTPARRLRRSGDRVEGSVTTAEGSVQQIDKAWLLAPLERSLRALSIAVVLVAVALAVGSMG